MRRHYAAVLFTIVSLSWCHRSFAIDYGLYVKGHVDRWLDAKDGGVAGMFGQSEMADAFRLSNAPFGVRFRIHAAKVGWRPWTKKDGQSDSAKGKQLEAIEFQMPANAWLLARVYLDGTKWSPIVVVRNDSILGTVGESRRLEAIQIWAPPAGSPASPPKQRLAEANEVIAQMERGEITRDAGLQKLNRKPAAGEEDINPYLDSNDVVFYKFVVGAGKALEAWKVQNEGDKETKDLIKGSDDIPYLKQWDSINTGSDDGPKPASEK
jgi:hypothetical protein